MAAARWESRATVSPLNGPGDHATVPTRFTRYKFWNLAVVGSLGRMRIVAPACFARCVRGPASISPHRQSQGSLLALGSAPACASFRLPTHPHEPCEPAVPRRGTIHQIEVGR